MARMVWVPETGEFVIQMAGGIGPGAAIALSGALAAGGSIFSGIFGSSAAKKQAEAIRYAADVARKTALELDERARGDVAPFRQFGVTAGERLSGILTGDIDLDESVMGTSLFRFQQAEGERAINRALSARGLFGSGAGLETLARFNAQLVGEEGIRYLDRLFNLTSLGSNAAARMATGTTQTGVAVADITARAGAQAGAAEADVLRSIGSIGPGLSRAFDVYAQNTLQLPLLNAITKSFEREGTAFPLFSSPTAPRLDFGVSPFKEQTFSLTG